MGRATAFRTPLTSQADPGVATEEGATEEGASTASAGIDTALNVQSGARLCDQDLQGLKNWNSKRVTRLRRQQCQVRTGAPPPMRDICEGRLPTCLHQLLQLQSRFKISHWTSRHFRHVDKLPGYTCRFLLLPKCASYCRSGRWNKRAKSSAVPRQRATMGNRAAGAFLGVSVSSEALKDEVRKALQKEDYSTSDRLD